MIISKSSNLCIYIHQSILRTVPRYPVQPGPPFLAPGGSMGLRGGPILSRFTVIAGLLLPAPDEADAPFFAGFTVATAGSLAEGGVAGSPSERSFSYSSMSDPCDVCALGGANEL
jgi:hypothetical protein